MRRVVRSLSLLAAVLGTLAAAPLSLAPFAAAPAAAADCAPATSTIPAAVASADAVATVVITKQVAPKTAHDKRLRYQATVQTSYKGAATGTITVLTKNQGCQLSQLAAGTTYLLFLNAHGNAWLAPGDLPSTSDNLAAAEQQVLAALAPPTVTFGRPQVGAPASLRRIAAPGVALVLIGLLGLLFVRRSPRPQA
jgi:hypothetical protein